MQVQLNVEFLKLMQCFLYHRRYCQLRNRKRSGIQTLGSLFDSQLSFKKQESCYHNKILLNRFIRNDLTIEAATHVYMEWFVTLWLVGPRQTISKAVERWLHHTIQEEHVRSVGSVLSSITQLELQEGRMFRGFRSSVSRLALLLLPPGWTRDEFPSKLSSSLNYVCTTGQR